MCIKARKCIPSIFYMKTTATATKTSIKIVVRAISTYLLFSFTYIILFCGKMKSCCDRCFPQQIRPQTTVQLYTLRDYSSERIGFSLNNKYHTVPIVCTTLFFKYVLFQSLVAYYRGVFRILSNI